MLSDRPGLAGADAREHFRILEFVAEREVVCSRLDQLVVFVEALARDRDRLHADEAADARPHGAHVGLDLPQSVE